MTSAPHLSISQTRLLMSHYRKHSSMLTNLDQVTVQQHELEVEPSQIKLILKNTNTLIILDGSVLSIIAISEQPSTKEG